MAKFKDDNLDLETGEHIDFDDADTIQMGYDGSELYINSTISGVRAAQPYQMVRYDQLLEAVSGTNEFIELTDTPATYSGYGDYLVSVKPDETGLEFLPPSSSGVGRSGQYDIPDATDFFTVTFSEVMSVADYYLVGSIENDIDAEPAKYGFNISNPTVSGFDIELSDITDSANYKFNYIAVDTNVRSVGVPGPPGEDGVDGIDGTTAVSGVSGQYNIPNGVEEFTVYFGLGLETEDYYLVGSIENQTDPEPAKYGFNISNTTISGFTIELSDITDSGNYKFNFSAMVAGDVNTIGIAVAGPEGPQGIQGIQGIQGFTGPAGSGIVSLEEDDAPQLGGDLYLNEHSIVITPEPSSDQSANGLVVPMQVDVNDKGFGAPLFVAADGNLEMANATTAASMPCIAIALEAGTGLKNCLLMGIIRDDSWDWNLGGVDGIIYMSTTSGVLTQTLVSGSGQQVQTVGYATHADRMYFNPQLPMVELS